MTDTPISMTPKNAKDAIADFLTRHAPSQDSGTPEASEIQHKFGTTDCKCEGCVLDRDGYDVDALLAENRRLTAQVEAQAAVIEAAKGLKGTRHPSGGHVRITHQSFMELEAALASPDAKPRHVCGLHGFQVGPDGIHDVCPACSEIGNRARAALASHPTATEIE